MFKFIRQIVQKLKKDIKVKSYYSSSHSNGNTYVSGSQSGVSREATFANCNQPFPIDIALYETYKKKSDEFDKRFGSLLKKKWLSESQYKVSRHYFALGTFD
jgi:hypothetical protein